MIPYSNFMFFGIMLYAVIPTLILGIFERAGRFWALCITTLYFVGQFSGQIEPMPGFSVPQLLVVAAFAAYEWFLAILFLRTRRASNSATKYHLALVLALAPLAASKFLPLVSPPAAFGFL